MRRKGTGKEMKYKELPLDDTKGNPFKRGDRVRVYSALGAQDCVVTEVRGKFVVSTNFGALVEAHWKQCRPIEEAKPREMTKENVCWACLENMNDHIGFGPSCKSRSHCGPVKVKITEILG